MKRILPQDFFDFALLFLLGFHFLANLTWILLNTAPIPWDQAGHTRLAMQFAEYFKSLGFLNVVEYLRISQYYPPLIHTIVAIPVLLFGHPVVVSELMITLFFMASIVLLYVYTNALFGKKLMGLLAAILFSFFPIVYEHSRWFLLEIPLITFLLATFYCLHKANSFTNKTYTYLAFIFAACALLAKWLAIVYLFVPFVFSIAAWLKLETRRRNETLAWIGKGVAIFLVLVLPWYIFNTSSLLVKVPIYIQKESSNPQAFFSRQYFLFYFQQFVDFQVTIYGLVLFICGLIYFHVKRLPYRWLFLAYLAFIYVVFTLIPNKNERYIMPMLPIVAIVIAALLYRIITWQKVLGSLFVIALTSILALYLLILSFRFPYSISYQKAVQLPLVGWLDYITINENMAHSYNQTRWPQQEILQAVYDRTAGHKVLVLCLVDQEHFNDINMQLTAELNHFDQMYIEPPPLTPLADDYERQQFLDRYDYAIVADNKIGVAATRNLVQYYQLKQFMYEQSNRPVEEVAIYPLPNGDQARLVKIFRI